MIVGALELVEVTAGITETSRVPGTALHRADAPPASPERRRPTTPPAGRSAADNLRVQLRRFSADCRLAKQSRIKRACICHGIPLSFFALRGMTSSHVSATRPGRPRAGDSANRVTAARIRSIIRVAARGLSAAIRSRISLSRRKSGEHIRGDAGVTAAATAGDTVPPLGSRTELRLRRAPPALP